MDLVLDGMLLNQCDALGNVMALWTARRGGQTCTDSWAITRVIESLLTFNLLKGSEGNPVICLQCRGNDYLTKDMAPE